MPCIASESLCGRCSTSFFFGAAFFVEGAVAGFAEAPVFIIASDMKSRRRRSASPTALIDMTRGGRHRTYSVRSA